MRPRLKRHGHVLLDQRDFSTLKEMLKRQQKKMSPFLRELIQRELVKGRKAEPQATPAS